jgi:DNA polymerase-3 subunit epsilon
MDEWTRLAFVDVETTGLSPTENRIAEIGVVTVDDGCVERWTTLLQPSSRREACTPTDSAVDGTNDAPRFRDIAADLARRLEGRLFVAHNARFDYSFLRAEFERAGIAFHPDVVCSVMLSRKLYPGLQRHDMDSLAECHGFSVEERHRALPDADLVWQLWRTLNRQHPKARIAEAVHALLSGPVLPPELDPSLIERLPETPGAYVFHGEGNRPLVVGAAGNLKRHVLNYFRIDRATRRASEYAHRIANITWRATRGMLGAQLHAAMLDSIHFADAKRRMNAPAFTVQLSPELVPCVAILPLESSREGDSFGLFPTERKARNKLSRLASDYRLCHRLLGIAGGANPQCLACPAEDAAPSCLGETRRKSELLRGIEALWPLRVPAWPHRGAVGIRERSDIHVVDQWQFLGTARCESDLHGLLEGRRTGAFDSRLYRLLRRTLSRLPADRIVDLSDHSVRPNRAALESTDSPMYQ